MVSGFPFTMDEQNGIDAKPAFPLIQQKKIKQGRIPIKRIAGAFSP